ncbi:alpha/beta hydrolase, partial [Mangrovimonas sp. AS39]|uniref:alpha/beta fold hydrolase n=1 Tax=Mangrovimonas futianensis TaxID=2895523 RepID=UPI001E4C0347
MGYINFKKSIRLIKAPTLILYGKNDSFVTETEVKDMAKAILDAKIVILNNPSHFLASRAQ